LDDRADAYIVVPFSTAELTPRCAVAGVTDGPCVRVVDATR